MKVGTAVVSRAVTDKKKNVAGVFMEPLSLRDSAKMQISYTGVLIARSMISENV